MFKVIEKIFEENIKIEEILSKDNLDKIELKTDNNSDIDSNKRIIFYNKINDLLKYSAKNKATLLLRGEDRKNLKKHLNSYYPEYELVFQVGTKAKNYIKDKVKPNHPIKNIHCANKTVAEWIFDKYSSFKNGPFDKNYFKTKNKADFVSKVKANQSLIDYYLFGLHTETSDNLVNYISSTPIPEVALHDASNEKIIILFWVNENNGGLYFNKAKLISNENFIKKMGLPLINDSFYPKENEYAIKGAIFPHFIIGLFDLNINRFVVNPWLFVDKVDWREDGFDIDQSSFNDFIKSTNYEKTIYLWNNELYE